MNLDTEIEQRANKRLFNKLLSGFAREAMVFPSGHYGNHQGEPRYRSSILESPACVQVRGGMRMERVTEEIRLATDELGTTRLAMEKAMNEVTALGDILDPMLHRQIENIRSSRMAVVSEVRDMLSMLRELRKFFLESDYATEMVRLQQFVTLCQELQRLKGNGTLDAVTDCAVKLAVKEEGRS